MIRKVVVSRFKKFQHLECNLQERALIAGPNNSGKTTLLQALATWAELGESWLESHSGSTHRDHRSFHRAEIEISSLRTLAPSNFEELWNGQDTREPISISVTTDSWEVGFDLHYQDAKVATVGPMSEVLADDLEAYALNPLKALYIPSLSGLDVKEPEYSDRVLATRLAHGKGGTVLRNMVQVASRDDRKWATLQHTVKSFFGFELSEPSGADPIRARYRRSSTDQWYDLITGAGGFLQTVMVQAALLHSDAKLFLMEEPDAHLHPLLRAKMYRLIREHCEENGCQALIATHSGRLIDQAAKESGEKLFLITENSLKPVHVKFAKDLLRIPSEEIVLAETTKRVLYLEGQSDLDILREWARVLDHPAGKHLDSAFWVATAERGGRNFTKRHYNALRAQVPMLRALEVRDRNSGEGEKWSKLCPGELRIEERSGDVPNGMRLAYWSRYEIENYLIHPAALLRFAQSQGSDAAERAETYMKEHLPPVVYRQPFGSTNLDRGKGKTIISEILAAAKVKLGEAEYYRLAAATKPDEVHPDIVTMLNEIEDQLSD